MGGVVPRPGPPPDLPLLAPAPPSVHPTLSLSRLGMKKREGGGGGEEGGRRREG